MRWKDFGRLGRVVVTIVMQQRFFSPFQICVPLGAAMLVHSPEKKRKGKRLACDTMYTSVIYAGLGHDHQDADCRKQNGRIYHVFTVFKHSFSKLDHAPTPNLLWIQHVHEESVALLVHVDYSFTYEFDLMYMTNCLVASACRRLTGLMSYCRAWMKSDLMIISFSTASGSTSTVEDA